MKYNRLLPVFVPLAVWGLLQLFSFKPALIYISLVLQVALLFFTFLQFCRESKSSKDWWNFLILPALFTIAVTAYATLGKNRLFVQALFFLDLAVLYLYLRFSFYYLIRPASYKVSAIENLSSFGSFLTFFLSAAAIYAFQSFISAPVGLLALFVMMISGLMIYQIIWVNNLKAKENLIHILVGCLVLVELAWTISFLPINYNIAGLTLAVFYYIFIGLTKHSLAGALDRTKVKQYLGFGLLSILLILLTAKWL